jgi:hypothetical protein
MHSLMLLTWLGAAAVAAEPVVIEVPSHALANPRAAKAGIPPTDLTDRAAHALRARIDADGRVHYDCADAAATQDFRFAARAARQEK